MIRTDSMTTTPRTTASMMMGSDWLVAALVSVASMASVGSVVAVLVVAVLVAAVVVAVVPHSGSLNESMNSEHDVSRGKGAGTMISTSESAILSSS